MLIGIAGGTGSGKTIVHQIMNEPLKRGRYHITRFVLQRNNNLF
jgi:dephospho-CoA kinase